MIKQWFGFVKPNFEKVRFLHEVGSERLLILPGSLSTHRGRTEVSLCIDLMRELQLSPQQTS